MAGSIEKRGRHSWRLTYDVGRDEAGNRVRRTATVRGSFDEAEKKLTELLSQRDQGIDVEPNRLTVGQFLAKWLDTHQVTTQSKNRYAQLIRRHVLPTLGAMRLTLLKPLHLQTCIADAALKVSPSTAQDVFTVMNMALAQAVRWQLLARNPATAVERPRVVESAGMRVLEPAEIERLLSAAAGTDFSLPIALTLATGLRRGEVLALKWPAIDFQSSTLRVAESARYAVGIGVVYGPPKSRKSRRTVAVSSEILALLKRHRTSQLEQRLAWKGPWGNDDGLVFTNKIGEPLPLGSFNARFSKIVAAAGLTPLRFHDLRHTHGTLLAGAGINPKVISDRLGHSDVKFTLNRYVTPTEDHQRAAAEAFSGLLKTARNHG